MSEAKNCANCQHWSTIGASYQRVCHRPMLLQDGLNYVSSLTTSGAVGAYIYDTTIDLRAAGDAVTTDLTSCSQWTARMGNWESFKRFYEGASRRHSRDDLSPTVDAMPPRSHLDHLAAKS